MTLASKLGRSYDQVRVQTKLRTIEIDAGEVKFNLKVRVPLKREMDSIVEDIAKPQPERIQDIYDRFSQPLRESINEGGEEFLKTLNAEKQVITVLDDDMIVDGNSIRQFATFTAMWEAKVERYFHLIQSETGEPVTESFAEISEEFPEPIIRQIVETIEGAIRPDYKNSKKN